ncbi:MAG: hypothetical protein K0S86_1333 [Geminicoccaceae bacterium]|nr:hypothetical protein [Geminicoccaceae bacterium]
MPSRVDTPTGMVGDTPHRQYLEPRVWPPRSGTARGGRVRQYGRRGVGIIVVIRGLDLEHAAAAKATYPRSVR